MKKFAFLLLVIAFSYSYANIERRLDKIIEQEKIKVETNTQAQLDSLNKIMTAFENNSTANLEPMKPGSDWFKNNWQWLLGVIIFLLEFFLRVAPTNKDWSLINKILSILIWIMQIIPNNAKTRNDIIKRGHDIKIKKIIEAYRNKKY